MRILVVGLMRNASDRGTREVERLYGVLSNLGPVEFFVVESDSDDRTVEFLESQSKSCNWFSYESLGQLRFDIPVRTMRLAHCRNRYVDEINRRELSHGDLVVAADLDLKFDLLNPMPIERAMASDDWDILTANQAGRYYDIWTLRHPQLSPNDYRSTLDLYISMGMSKPMAALRTLYPRMISIPSDWPRIPVQSAFGGLALYRPWVFQRARYRGLDADGREVSDHVPFNLDLVEQGARIFIEPSLVTTKKTEHSSLTGVAQAYFRERRTERRGREAGPS